MKYIGQFMFFVFVWLYCPPCRKYLTLTKKGVLAGDFTPELSITDEGLYLSWACPDEGYEYWDWSMVEERIGGGS
jgi:hypothetical protein